MPRRYAPKSELTERTLGRLVSLSSERAIAQARQAGLAIPADIRPSARVSIDPRTGHLYGRTSTETAKTFYKDPSLYRTMSEATPKKAAREQLLQESGLTFRGGDWSERYERDLRLDAIERAYRERVRLEGRRPGRLYAPGSEFRQALGRLSQPTPPRTKDWRDFGAAMKKIKALETLGLRPRGWTALPGKYTPAELAAAWQASGQTQPRLTYVYRKTGGRRR